MDYCITMALAYIYKLVPTQYINDSPDLDSEDSDFDEFMARVKLYGT